MAKITVASYSISNWQDSTTTELRLFVSHAFTASTGEYIPQGSPDNGQAYRSITLSYNSGTKVLTIPEITLLDSTIDGRDYRLARYSAFFYNSSGVRVRPFEGFTSFAVPDIPASTTWSALRIYNTGSGPLFPDEYYTKYQVNQLIMDVGGGEWGQITGTLSDQSDLNTAISARVLDTGDTMTGDLTLSGTTTSIIGFKDKGGQVFNVKSYGAIGDGVANDYAAINSAITAAAAVKGTVYLPQGTYNIGTKLLLPSDVTLAGSGWGTTIHGLASMESGSPTIHINNVSRVTVRDMTLSSALADANGAVNIQGSTAIKVINVRKLATHSRWIVFVGNTGFPSTDVLIGGVRSEGSTDTENIAVVESSYVRVVNSYLKQTTSVNGIELFVVTAGTIKGNVISNNVFEAGSGGVHDLGGLRTVISNNHFFGQTNFGILVEGSPTAPFDDLFSASITGNTVHAASVASFGISTATTSRNCVVAGNTVSNSANLGIVIAGVGHSVTGNTVQLSTSQGLTVTASFSSITGNTVVNNSRGINVAGDFNTIIGNVATDTRTPKIQDLGLVFEAGADNNRYALNQLSGNLSGTITDLGANNGIVASGEILTVPGIIALPTSNYIRSSASADWRIIPRESDNTMRFWVNAGNPLTLGSASVLLNTGAQWTEVNVGGDLTLTTNNKFLNGVNSGGSATVALIGLNGSNQVSIAPAGTATVIGGTLAVTGDVTVPDEAYDATAWNGSLEVPTKNAIRDKIESLSVGGSQTPWTSNIDADSFSLLFDDATGIKSSEAGNPELLLFTSVASAVNELTVTNAATGNNPIISATGGDTNIGITLTPKGTGGVVSTGQVLVPDGSASAPTLAFSANPNVGFYQQTAGAVVLSLGNVAFAQWYNGSSPPKFALKSDAIVAWSSSTPDAANPDTALGRVSAAVVKVTDGSSGRGDLEVADDPYDATNWNGSFEVPTKNAIRDKIESLGGGPTINATDGVIPYRSSSTAFSDSPLVRADANTLEQYNSTNAQTFNIYRTRTDASNYERGFAKWNGTVFEIGTTGAGTGDPDRTLRLKAGSSTYNFDAFGNVSGIGTIDIASGRFAVGAGVGVQLGNAMPIKWYDSTQVFGTNDLAISRSAANLLGLTDGSTGGAGIEFVEHADFSAPGSNKAILYLRDNGSGKTQLVVRFPTGAVQVIATEP